MSETDITPQEGTNPEPQIEVEESITEDEAGEPQAPAQPKTYSEEEFKQVLARAKTAEAKLKATQPKPAEPKQINNPNVPSEEYVQTTILKAQGVSQDEIDYLKKLAAVNGTGLIEAQNDDLFKAFKQKKESDSKAQKAQLGASRGSGQVRKEKTLNTPGLTEAEHKELWKQRQGR
jgi:hypothetical protein